MPRLLLPLLLALGAAGAAAALEVKVEADPAIDFAQFRTYAWGEITPGAVPTVTHQRILAAVERELARAGLRRVDADPDLLVTYHGSASDEVEPAKVVSGYGGKFFGGVGWQQVPEKRYRRGTLVLQIGDPRREALVWQGTASDSIQAEPEKNAKKIEKAVKKLLDRLPRRK